MTCACEFSGWVREWLAGFGAGAPFVLAGLTILWWGRKSLRREHFGRMPAGQAWAQQWPAIALFALGATVLLLAQIVG